MRKTIRSAALAAFSVAAASAAHADTFWISSPYGFGNSEALGVMASGCWKAPDGSPQAPVVSATVVQYDLASGQQIDSITLPLATASATVPSSKDSPIAAVGELSSDSDAKACNRFFDTGSRPVNLLQPGYDYAITYSAKGMPPQSRAFYLGYLGGGPWLSTEKVNGGKVAVVGFYPAYGYDPDADRISVSIADGMIRSDGSSVKRRGGHWRLSLGDLAKTFSSEVCNRLRLRYTDADGDVMVPVVMHGLLYGATPIARDTVFVSGELCPDAVGDKVSRKPKHAFGRPVQYHRIDEN
jgi:hypothetical protein